MVALAIIAAQAADLLTFLLAVKRVGIEAEANPLAVLAYNAAGPLGVVSVKVALTGVILVVISRLYGGHRKRLAVFAVIVGLAGALSNTAVAM